MSRTRRRVSVALLGAAILFTTWRADAATKRAFVSSAGCNGNLGDCTPEIGDSGVDAANNICQARAHAADLDLNGEVFRAWLSDPNTDAYCNVLGLAGKRFTPPACGVGTLPDAGPWQRLDGVPFAASIDDLVGAGPITPMSLTETGAITLSAFIASGSLLNGTNSASRDCNDWTDTGTPGVQVSGGNPDVMNALWISGGLTGCGGQMRLLCFEVGAGDPLDYPSEPAALAFVSSGTYQGDLGGIVGADATCAALAAAAFLPVPSTFLAFLSDSSSAAADRLAADVAWKRVDRVRIADSKADLLDGSLDTAIAYDEQDGKHEDDTWTGTLLNGTAGPTHCVDWGSNLDTDTGVQGRNWRNGSRWTGTENGTRDCDVPARLYCFSNQVVLGWDSFESGNFNRWSESFGAP